MSNHHTTPPSPRFIPQAVTEFLGVHDPRVARVLRESEALQARLAAEAKLRPFQAVTQIPSPGLIPVPALAKTITREEETQRRIRESELNQQRRSLRQKLELQRRVIEQLQFGLVSRRVGPSLIPVPGVARAIAIAEARRFTLNPPPRH